MRRAQEEMQKEADGGTNMVESLAGQFDNEHIVELEAARDRALELIEKGPKQYREAVKATQRGAVARLRKKGKVGPRLEKQRRRNPPWNRSHPCHQTIGLFGPTSSQRS